MGLVEMVRRSECTVCSMLESERGQIHTSERMASDVGSHLFHHPFGGEHADVAALNADVNLSLHLKCLNARF